MADTQIPRLIPAPGRLVVEALEETMWGGLHLPVKAQEKPMMGRITALPPGYEGATPHPDVDIDEDDWWPSRLAVGEVVVFGQNSGMSVDIGAGSARRRAIILREQDVLAKVVYDPTPTSEITAINLVEPSKGIEQDFNGELLPTGKAQFEYDDSNPDHRRLARESYVAPEDDDLLF